MGTFEARLTLLGMFVAFASACFADTTGITQQAAQAWGCDDVSVVQLDSMSACSTASADADHQCFKVVGCGKTTFVPCTSSPGNARHSHTQLACGTVSSDARATNGQTYAKWSEALVESAKKDIPCTDVRPINFREGNVAASPWILEGCAVRVTYVEGAKESGAATLVLTSRAPSATP
jgi:hypothetical protein